MRCWSTGFTYVSLCFIYLARYYKLKDCVMGVLNGIDNICFPPDLNFCSRWASLNMSLFLVFLLPEYGYSYRKSVKMSTERKTRALKGFISLLSEHGIISNLAYWAQWMLQNMYTSFEGWRKFFDRLMRSRFKQYTKWEHFRITNSYKPYCLRRSDILLC